MLLQPSTAILPGNFNIFNSQLLTFDFILYTIILRRYVMHMLYVIAQKEIIFRRTISY